LLTPENCKRYFTPAKDGYAYGWAIRQEDGYTATSHGGGINGFSTMIVRVPEKKLVVVALSNLLLLGPENWPTSSSS